MAGVSAQGATFSFTGLTATVTRVAVESREAEVVDMTNTAVTSASEVYLVPTGAWSGGSIRVDYIHPRGNAAQMTTFARATGVLSFVSSDFAATSRAICVSVSAEAALGDVVRGAMNFVPTDSTHQISVT